MKTYIFSGIKTNNVSSYDDRAGYKGITLKTALGLGITILVAVATSLSFYYLFYNHISTLVATVFISMFVALIAAFVGRLSAKTAKVCIFIYSISSGFLLGVLTTLVEALVGDYVKGAGIIAMFSTMIIFAIMLVLFQTGVVKNCSVLQRVMMALGLGLISLVIFSVITVLVIGSTNIWLLILMESILLIYDILALTFNFEEAKAVVENGCSKDDEWSVALGMIISLVYIYIELLYIIMYVAMIFGRKN